MPAEIDLRLAGADMVLMADRALLWADRRCLLIADLHLGKGDAFRAAGLAVPSGGSTHDLGRLDALIARTGARELLILGDMVHGPLRSASWLRAWSEFRLRHGALQIRLVGGNHDRRIDARALGLDDCVPRIDDSGLSFVHEPAAAAPDESTPSGAPTPYVVCGHVHPVVRVPGFPGRFAAFVQQPDAFVLPAFSDFTGGWHVPSIHPRWACMRGSLLALLPRNPARLPARPQS